MTTLYDVLKRQQSTATKSAPARQHLREDLREDLRARYSAIGISAVAAAVRYQRAPDDHGRASTRPPDRSTARGWSGNS
jgi:hypothetical protein